MKPREFRRKVMISARMRHGNAWDDASILNISSRGLLLHAAVPPSRGTYVEGRRGMHVIVGRVMWANADRFGVSAQDQLAIDSLVANGSPDRRPADETSEVSVERRIQPTPDRLHWRHAQSREKGRALQFACIAGFGLILATCAYDVVSKTLSKPLVDVSTRLSGAP